MAQAARYGTLDGHDSLVGEKEAFERLRPIEPKSVEANQVSRACALYWTT